MKLPLILFPLLFLVSGCFLAKQEAELAPALIETPDISYDVTEAFRGDVQQIIEVDGVFVNRDRTSLYFAPSGGYLKDIYVSVGTRVQPGQLLAEMDTRQLDYRYNLESLALEKAELLYRKNSAPGMSDVEKEMARISYEEQKLRTEQAYRDLANAKIYAPYESEIVFKETEYVRGEFVPAYDTLLQLAKPGTLEIMYEGTQKDFFVSGMYVDIRLKRRRDETYRAEVIQTPRDTPKDDSDDFSGEVFFRVLNDIDGIRRGTECDISIVLKESFDTVLIPKNLINTNNGLTFVYVLEDDMPQQRLVETGVVSSLHVEILEGLEEGEQIVNR